MSPDSIRTVALIGHGGSGKTSLAEALLYAAGVTTRLGSVDQGTTLLDHEPEEEERKLSLNLSVASLDWDGCKINLIDTPGYADFSGDARSAIRVADLALFVVSGVDGVEVQTELMWKVAAEEGTPRRCSSPNWTGIAPRSTGPWASCARRSAWGSPPWSSTWERRTSCGEWRG